MDSQLVLTQVTASAIVVGVLQWLKRTKWVPFVSLHSATINRVIAAVGAALVALKIHMVYDPAVATLTITGLSFAVIAHAAWDYAKSFVLQELIYRGFVQPNQDPGASGQYPVATATGFVKP